MSLNTLHHILDYIYFTFMLHEYDINNTRSVGLEVCAVGDLTL